MDDTPPLSPDAPTAREWVTHELAKREYHRRESLMRRFLRWLSEHMVSGHVGVGGLSIPAGLVAAVAAVILVAVVIVSWRRFRPTRRIKPDDTGRESTIFDGERLDADTYARQARDARSVDSQSALLAAFRAVAARAHEVGLLTLTKHSTVSDIVTELRPRLLGPTLPSSPGPSGDTPDAVRRAGALFERVRYGHGDVDGSDVDLVIALDDEVRRAATSPSASQSTPSDPERGAGR